MNVLSLFDGISCGQIALQRAGITVDNYYASEIDKYAIQVAQHNWPNTIQLGSILNINVNNLPKIDLIIAGSPCQGFSNSGNMENFNHKSSKLFYEFLRILNEIKPTNFLLENVKMKKEWRDKITSYLKVKPIMIDSALVSAQKRRRYYWTNIKNVVQPIDRKIFIKDILLDGDAILRWQNSKDGAVIDYKKSATLRASGGTDIRKRQKVVLDIEDDFIVIKEATKAGVVIVNTNEIFDAQFPDSKTRRGRLMSNKTNCLTTSIDWQLYLSKGKTRPISPIECERLQTVPDNYTACVSNTQRYKALGNGWNIETIAHILKNLNHK